MGNGGSIPSAASSRRPSSATIGSSSRRSSATVESSKPKENNQEEGIVMLDEQVPKEMDQSSKPSPKSNSYSEIEPSQPHDPAISTAAAMMNANNDTNTITLAESSEQMVVHGSLRWELEELKRELSRTKTALQLTQTALQRSRNKKKSIKSELTELKNERESLDESLTKKKETEIQWKQLLSEKEQNYNELYGQFQQLQEDKQQLTMEIERYKEDAAEARSLLMEQQNNQPLDEPKSLQDRRLRANARLLLQRLAEMRDGCARTCEIGPRVYWSSTFEDCKEERAEFQRKLPQLEELCARSGRMLSVVDIRDGVSDDDATIGHVMAAILKEIAQCTYFACFVSSIYGATVDSSGGANTNTNTNNDSNSKWKFGQKPRSAIDIEVSRILSQSAQWGRQAWFYFRKINAASHQSAHQIQRLSNMKERILQSGLRVCEDYETPAEGAALIIADLTAAITRDYIREQPHGDVHQQPSILEMRENFAHRSFFDVRSKLHVGLFKDALIMKMDEHVQDLTTYPLILYGERGCGKSSLLAAWCYAWTHEGGGYTKEGKGARGIPGSTVTVIPVSSRALPMLASKTWFYLTIMQQLKHLLGLDITLPVHQREILKFLPTLLDAAAKSENYVLALDLDAFNPEYRPSKKPGNMENSVETKKRSTKPVRKESVESSKMEMPKPNTDSEDQASLGSNSVATAISKHSTRFPSMLEEKKNEGNRLGKDEVDLLSETNNAAVTSYDVRDGESLGSIYDTDNEDWSGDDDDEDEYSGDDYAGSVDGDNANVMGPSAPSTFNNEESEMQKDQSRVWGLQSIPSMTSDQQQKNKTRTPATATMSSKDEEKDSLLRETATWLWGNDELDDIKHELSVIPAVQPKGCVVIATASSKSALHHAQSKGYTIIEIPTLTETDARLIASRVLGSRGKRLSEKEWHRIWTASGATSQCWLRLFLNEYKDMDMIDLSYSADARQLSYMLGCGSIDQLWQVVLASWQSKLEKARVGGVGELLALIASTRTGLAEHEAFHLLGMPRLHFFPLWSTVKHFLLGLDSGVANFATWQLRMTVDKRYRGSDAVRKSVHERLEHYFSRTTPKANPRAIEEIPFQLLCIGKLAQLNTFLGRIGVFYGFYSAHRDAEYIQYWRAAGVATSSDGRSEWLGTGWSTCASTLCKVLDTIEKHFQSSQGEQSWDGGDEGAVHNMQHLASIMSEMSRFLLDTNQVIACANVLMKLVAISEKIHGGECAEVAAASLRVADVYWKLSRFLEALPFAERALKIRCALLDTTSASTVVSRTLDIAEVKCKLGLIHLGLNNLEQAAISLQEALDMRESCLGGESIAVAETMTSLAQVLLRQNRREESQAMQQKANTLMVRMKRLTTRN